MAAPPNLSVQFFTSTSLQYGVPLEQMVNKFAYQRFEPSGFTSNPDIRSAYSITDYVFRWIGCQFIQGYRKATSPGSDQADLPMPELPEMEKRAINRPVPELSLADHSPHVAARVQTSLGTAYTSKETLKKAKPQQFGIAPKESPSRTPALNVYFELNPEYDDYEGAPKSWRDFMAVPRPSATILLIMTFGTADHVMAQYFSGTAADFPAPRKGREKGCVLWVDGHATLEASGSMFDSSLAIDHFHPERTR